MLNCYTVLHNFPNQFTGVTTNQGTATPGAAPAGDYTAIAAVEQTFGVGVDFTEYTLMYHTDNVIEDIETLTISIDTPSPDSTAVVVEPAIATVFIMDETGTYIGLRNIACYENNIFKSIVKPM